jgi:hypothetical protein
VCPKYDEREQAEQGGRCARDGWVGPLALGLDTEMTTDLGKGHLDGRATDKATEDVDWLGFAIGAQDACGRSSPGLSVFPCMGRFTDQAWALAKRSPKRMANWAFAMAHSRGGKIHSFSARCNTRNSSLMAASSVGKCPRALTARRSLAFNAYMELVTGISSDGASCSRWWRFSSRAYGATIRDRGTGSTQVRAGRSIR